MELVVTVKYFSVGVYSHHFVLSQVQALGLNVIESFAKQFVQFGLIKKGRKFIRAPIKVFAARIGKSDRVHEYRFHINQFQDFVKHLTNMQILPHTYEISYNQPHVGLDVLIKVLDKWVSKDYQIPIISYLVSDKPSHTKLLETQTGSGKAQPLHALVKVPGGWEFMGDLKVNDEVIAKDGTVTKVTGVYPQGKKEIYRITFADGRTAECCAEHLWRVFYINTTINRRWRIVNTIEMMRLISMPNPRVYVDLIDPEEGVDKELVMDPYVLGLLLGDGHIGNHTLKFSKSDKEIIQALSNALPDDLRLSKTNDISYDIVRKDAGVKRNVFLDIFRKLGLSGKLSYQKFIPEEYLFSSRTQRLSLLQGILDTDGTVSETGHVSYSTSSLQLALNVQYLIRSLGGIAHIGHKTPTYSYKGEKKVGRKSYVLSIRHKKPSELFRLTRKKIRTNDNNQYSKDLKLRVMKIESIGQMEAQCISIDHPEKLYVTNDFVVTHNTFCAASALAELGKRFVIIIKPMYVDKWISDLKEILGLTTNDITVVQGNPSLMNLIACAKQGLLTSKAIIISNRTLQSWFKSYEDKGNCIEDEGYDCNPSELFEVLGAGVRLIDEVHQDFHLNFKIDLYTNIQHTISLSATLKGDDPFLNRMYELAYPREIRYAGLAYNRYVYAYSWIYQVKEPAKLRTTEWGSTIYSHHAFERSVLQNRQLLSGYLDMIVSATKQFFIKKYQKGERLLIYCASIQMCTIVTERLSQQFKDLCVKRYVEDDPYENLMQADISVSTLLSAGTGVDIPLLTTVILTTAVSSSQSNIQGFGRLRKIPDKKLQFIYFVCSDSSKHLEYHEKKKDMLRNMALQYDSVNYNTLVGS